MTTMTTINTEFLIGQPDRLYVEIDRRFNLVIERTEDGLALHVYPYTRGKVWDHPFAAFEVDESEIIALEQELED